MHLTPRERERLLLAAAADLARRRLARGAPLGATEAVALVCDEICELAWDGVALETVIERARAVVPAAALLPGVAGLVPVLEVEALFPWGSTLVHVDAPFADDQNPESERSVASPGTADSSRPPADANASAPGAGEVRAAAVEMALALGTAVPGPGEVHAAAGVITLAPGAPRQTVVLRNTGHRDVWISSHFPLDQVNPAVEIEFADEAEHAVTGCRLDLPAGEALLLRPGEARTATIVVVSGGQA
jgi:urease subunit gamma/beta